MTQLEKVRFAVEDLVARGVRKPTASPLLYRLLWHIGVATPPPLFQSFLGAFVLQGCSFGLLLGAVLACADRRLAPNDATLLGIGGGTTFGVLMGLHYWWYARRLGLPKWDDYTPGEPAEKEPDW
jgi:hypothetical protein